MGPGIICDLSGHNRLDPFCRIAPSGRKTSQIQSDLDLLSFVGCRGPTRIVVFLQHSGIQIVDDASKY